ncbi:hypothetical protein P43SY_005443 [Pythium insidiosum]|uniref:Phosphodiesterase n=1 Tax=Pythium insidiosum TaxID=114742 RepID=A0AAD5QAE6_PYTIN|nr:hypothetical protein P43SY_005443 [Pythium insidiosum]
MTITDDPISSKQPPLTSRGGEFADDADGDYAYVPIGALKELVRGARSQSEDERQLRERLFEKNKRIQMLKAKTLEVEHRLAQYKTDHRQSMLAHGGSSSRLSGASPERNGSIGSSSSKSGPGLRRGVPLAGSTSIASVGVGDLNLLPGVTQASRAVIVRERVTQLEEVMTSVKEISAQGEFEDVITRTLTAAQKLVKADRYTLGLLNERRNVVEIFSINTRKKTTSLREKSSATREADTASSDFSSLSADQVPTPRRRIYSTFGIAPSPTRGATGVPAYISEGFVAADSATTFGRVIMTGKPLHIEDFIAHENYDDQIKSEGGVSPRALLCLPICNANAAVVGILQVVSMTPPPTGPRVSVSDPQSSMPSSADTVTAGSPGPQPPPPTLATANMSSSRRLLGGLEKKSVFGDNDKKSLEFLAVVAGAAIWNLILLRERQTAQSRIEGLLKLHRNISMEAVSSAVLDQVLSVCHELIGTERIGLFMKVEGEDELYIACAADIVRGEYVPITKGIVGHVARTGEVVITNDAYSHPMFDPTLDHKTGFVTKRILCLPVRSPEGKILAVISAVNKIDNTDFSSEDAIFLNYAAEAVGISMHKASLHHQVKTSQKLIEARLKLTTFISESSDIERFVDIVVDIGKDIMECDRFGLLLIDHFKKELWITPRAGGGGRSIRTPMNRGISGLVATTGQTVCTRDAYRHELFDPSVDLKTGYRTTSVLCMPIFEDHALATTPKVVAVAMCINKKEGSHVVAFTQTDRDVMDKFCREVQFALGRLSLDISYYKVVFDCIAVGGNAESSAAMALGLKASASRSSGAAGGGLSVPRVLDGYSETDIISSIVHKYCNSAAATGRDAAEVVDDLGARSTSLTAAAAVAAAAAVTTGAEHAGQSLQLGDPNGDALVSAASASSVSSSAPAIAALVPALLRKKQEDDQIPFPREIAFPGGADDPLDQWDLDTLAMSSADIIVAVGVLFRAYGFLETFRIPGEKFAAFATNVANYYRSNPFHNFQHAFHVLLTMHVMLRCECRKYFSGVEIFSMLLAALCHDVDHPGNTNDFELKTLSPMALTHNDDAVLERHHCRVTFIILNHKSSKILQHLDEARYKRVRQLIIHCILATDMSKHFDKCKALENLTRRQLTDKRQLLMGILIHAADLAFHAMPFRAAHDWGARLLDEFQHQARSEAEHGIPTDFFMHNLESRKTRLIVALNLINYVARPIWLPLTSLCHHLRCQFYTDELEKNHEHYQRALEDCRQSEQQQQQRQLQQQQQGMVAAAVAIAPSTITVTAAPVTTTPSTPTRPHLQKRSSSFSNASHAMDSTVADAVRLVHQQDAASSAAALSFAGPGPLAGPAAMSPRSPSLKRSSFSAPRRSPLE